MRGGGRIRHTVFAKPPHAFHKKLLYRAIVINIVVCLEWDQVVTATNDEHLRGHLALQAVSHRDGKSRYLDDIPLTLKYLISALKNDAELADLYNMVISKVYGSRVSN